MKKKIDLPEYNLWVIVFDNQLVIFSCSYFGNISITFLLVAYGQDYIKNGKVFLSYCEGFDSN